MKKNRYSLRHKYMLGLLAILTLAMMLTTNIPATPIDVYTNVPYPTGTTNATLGAILYGRGDVPGVIICQKQIAYKQYQEPSYTFSPYTYSPTYYDNQTTLYNFVLFNSTRLRYANKINNFNGVPMTAKFYFSRGSPSGGTICAKIRYSSNDTVITSSALLDITTKTPYVFSYYNFWFINPPHIVNKNIYVSLECSLTSGYVISQDANTNIAPNWTVGWYYNGTAWNPWTEGRILYSFNYYPNSLAYNYSLTLLTPGQRYRYYAKAYNPFSTPDTATGTIEDFLTKPVPNTNFNSPTATTNSINLNWILEEGADGAYIEYTTGALPSPWNPGLCTKINTSGYITGSTYIHSGLAYTGLYHYKAWTYAEEGGMKSNGSSYAFWGDNPLTITTIKAPEAPTNTNINVINATSINMSWTKGTNANKTVIIKKANSAPTSITDGTTIYNGTGTYTVQTITPGQLTFYRAWSYRYYTSPSASRYSINTSYFNASGLYVTVQDEENCTNLTYDILIKNQAGTQTYSQTGLTGLLVVNTTLCPQGLVSIIISAVGHRYRQFYLTITNASFFFYLPVYLPSNASSDLYLLQVYAKQNEYFASPPIHQALVTIRSYINCSDAYYDVSNTYTDANGQTEIYLIRSKLHIVVIQKNLYTSVIEDYTTDSSYRQRVFRMYYEQTSITPDQTIFTNITWSVEPTSTIHYTAYPITFNITSSDNKLEWFYMKVYYYNQTLDTWNILYSSNQTNASGGSITFTIPNATGKYAIDCVFKKQGYPAYELSQTGSLIQFIQHLNQAFIGIPDMAFFVGLIIIMMLVMGFFVLYIGSGVLVGYVGLGIFFMGLLMKPLTIPIGGQDSVSGWVIFAITFLAYTMGTFLWSRL